VSVGKLPGQSAGCSTTSATPSTSANVVEERGGNAKLIDWLDEITGDCPKKQAHNMNDPCGARFPDLPRVL
jgi:hypothetical protein